MKHTPPKLTSIETVGRVVLIRLDARSPESEWPIVDATQRHVPDPIGFWDRCDKRWIVTDTSRQSIPYPERFWDQFEELCDIGHRRFVVDFSEELDEDFDIEVMVRTYKRVREIDGWVGLVATGRVRDLLSLTQLGEMFPIFDNREDALAAAESEW